MPLRHSSDSSGKYYQWGNANKRYYYNSESERKSAKQQAIRQGYAIEKSKERRGESSELARSGTGRKTELKGIDSKRSKSRSRKSKSRSRKSK